MKKVRVYIMPKKGVLDPQGKAIQNSLHNLNYPSVSSVRQGKLIELEINEDNQDKLKDLVNKACSNLLSNTVMEDYSFEIIE